MEITQMELPIIKGDISKHEIHNKAKMVVDDLFNGDGIDVFNVVRALSVMESFIKALREDKNFVGFVWDELSKYPGGKLSENNIVIEKMEAGVKYNYSSNPSWVELQSQIDALTKKKKKLEEFLRQIPQGKQMADPETGEVFTGPIKTSVPTYKITLPE